jgi:hypothetical protein
LVIFIVFIFFIFFFHFSKYLTISILVLPEFPLPPLRRRHLLNFRVLPIHSSNPSSPHFPFQFIFVQVFLVLQGILDKNINYLTNSVYISYH